MKAAKQIENLAIQIIPKVLRRYLIKKRIKRKFKEKLGYELNLESPQSYCEKVQWLKLNYLEHNSLVVQCADKYRVREYIEKQGLGDMLIELYGSWDKAEDILWDTLPGEFVLKLNNGSGKKYIWLISNKDSVNKKAVVQEINNVLHRKYGYKNGEFHYSKILPKIIAERYLRDDGRDIKDYKFFCFNGEIAFLSIERGRQTKEYARDYYDTDLNVHPVKFHDDVRKPDKPFEKPENFERMIDVVKLLSKGHPHVRVDLYNIDGRIYIGELTFSSECGYTRWDPVRLDFEYGKLIDIGIAKSYLESKQKV